jgi:uncharacterized membrane protein YhaH (DUF805 family)
MRRRQDRLREAIMDIGYLYTSFEGRINRAKYWLATIILVVAIFIVMFVVGFVLGMSIDPSDIKFKAVVFVFQLIFLYPSAAVMVKRLHDRNRPGYFAAFMLVPVITDMIGITGDVLNMNALYYLLSLITLAVAVWFFVELGCLRGTIGDNQYGPDPLAGKA